MTSISVQKILVVDDSQASYNLICDFLAVIHDHQVESVWASTYDEGIEHIRQQVFDVCLIDYELDKNTGLDFIRQVVSDECQTPLILLTGYGSRQIDLEAMRAGAVDYLDKTQLRPEMLERSIRYAVEQTRILKAERDQRALAEALLDISTALNSTLDLQVVLERILLNLETVIPHDTANIMLIENDQTRIVGYKGYNSPELEREIANSRFNVRKIRSFAEIIVSRKPLIIPDILKLSNWLKLLGGPHRLRSYMGAPILLGDQIIGLINLESYQPDFFTETHSMRLQLFASQSAVAIQNAFAYQHAQERAAAEQRQRIAHDLHDAVSQTLFSASVIAETLPRLFERDPAEVEAGLVKLASLTRGALAEMRTLLVELRPTALLEMDLSVLIQQLVTGLQSRSSAEIRIELAGQEWALPEDVHISLYRIAQESINNVIKHSRATRAEIYLTWEPDAVYLRVVDDGRGFDPENLAPERMGVRIMNERATTVDIALNIMSAAGQGTTVEAVWKKAISNG